MGDRLRILVIDDCVTDFEIIQRRLTRDGLDYLASQVWCLDIARDALRHQRWDVILCDHVLPSFCSTDFLDLIDEMGLEDIPTILISGALPTEVAVNAMRRGVNDFVFKNDLSRLAPAILREVEKANIKQEKQLAESRLAKANQSLQSTIQSLTTTQDQLAAAERYRALGQMASGIAHEFNNVLTKILGSVDMLEERPGNPQYVDQMRLQLADATSIVKRLSEFYCSNPTAGESVVDIVSLLRETKHFTQPKWNEASGNCRRPITVEVAEGEPIGVWGEANRLREALSNLIFNACDAIGSEGGEIFLRAKVREDRVIVIVTDTGCGMCPEVKNRCLEPLFSTKGDSGGGLGLSTTQGIVESFGGSITIQSEEDAGTTVILTLRAAEIPENQNGSGSIGTERYQEHLRIAVVDDEPAIASLMERYLSRLGHTVAVYTDPVAASREICDTNCDLVFLDRSMPQLGGGFLAKEIRARYSSIRCVMVSGYGDLMVANGETLEGVDLIVGKPISIDRLREAIDELFGDQTELLELSG